MGEKIKTFDDNDTLLWMTSIYLFWSVWNEKFGTNFFLQAFRRLISIKKSTFDG